MPASNSNIYVTGDCNGTGGIHSSGSLVAVDQFNSQCGAATVGCGGAAVHPAVFRLTFNLGSWTYVGANGAAVPDSTQTADLLGRTWVATPTDGTQLHFVWTCSGASPTTPTPVNTPTGTITPPTNTPTPSPTPGNFCA